MNDDNDIRRLLQSAIPPAVTPDRDLWPQMLRRAESRPALIPWFEWALAAAALAMLAFSPATIPILLNWL